ncbi:hypothetical protein [Nocardiopsis ansamitocini]|nr:hypothetical protein [Nocardiopsis ansamitocini]
MRAFLRWVGDRREVSRDQVGTAAGVREYVPLSIGAWVEDDDVATEPPECEMGDAAPLLAFALEARVLEMVVDRNERRPGGGHRQHGWVIPGPEYVRMPRDAARLWRMAVERLPLLWRQRDVRIYHRVAQPLVEHLLSLLTESGENGVAVSEFVEASGREGLPRSSVEVAVSLLGSLNLVRHDYDLDVGERCALTPLGRHATTLLLPASS